MFLDTESPGWPGACRAAGSGCFFGVDQPIILYVFYFCRFLSAVRR